MTPSAPLATLATVALLSGLAHAQQSGLYSFNNTGCPGTNGTPFLQTAGNVPMIGATFQLAISNLSTSQADPAFMFTRILSSAPTPLDAIGMTGCVLEVSPAVISVLAKDAFGNATWSLTIPDDPNVVGNTFFNQVFAFDRPTNPANWPNAFGATVSNSGSGVVGGAVEDREIVESFDTQDQFDLEVSSARWGAGNLVPGMVGGSGIHGKFDINLLPFDQDDQAFIWDTDVPLVVPSSSTLLDQGDLTITDGQAEFSEFSLLAPQNIRFVGSKAPVIRVSGIAFIQGDINLDGQAGDVPSTPNGGTGGSGGAGGGSGGDGATGFLPAVPPGVNTPDPNIHMGRDGEDLRVSASSGYAGAVAGTGGSGQAWFPASGLHEDVNTAVANFYSSQQMPGAGGGGYLTAGEDGSVPNLLIPGSPDVAPVVPGGIATPFQDAPPGVDALEHFQVGGSGGGGAGTVCTLVRPTILSPTWMRWIHGFGGAGGGGALGMLVGAGLEIANGSTISASGGTPHSSLGNTFSSRGTNCSGGGSGGTLFFQVTGDFTQNGTLRVAGGQGGVHECFAPGGADGVALGGDGAPGFVRLEQPNGPVAGDLGNVEGPASLGAQNVGMLQSRDTRTVARSGWYPMPALGTPSIQSYELRVRLDGVLQIFTDDPQGPNPADDPAGPVRLLLQGATLGAGGEPIATPGAWVDSTAALGATNPNGFRFIVFFDRSVVDMPTVEEFTLRYQG